MFKKATPKFLGRDEQDYLLNIARNTIADCLTRKADSPPENPAFNLEAKLGVFVTLTKGDSLRGCMGSVEARRPLPVAVKVIAQSAAFHDPRFPPVRQDELREVDIEISVLSPPKPVKSIDEIKVPRHGVFLRHGHASAILLPQVAVKHNWNRKDLLEHACRKAGLKKEAWESSATEVMVFEAQVFSENRARNAKEN